MIVFLTKEAKYDVIDTLIRIDSSVKLFPYTHVL